MSSALPTATQSSADLPPVVLNGEVYFLGDDAANGRELWKSDGTTAGTKIVADLTPGPAGTRINRIVVAGGRVFFAADPGDNIAGDQLFETDGTAANTRPVAQGTVFRSTSNPNVYLSTVQDLAASGSDLYWGGFAQNEDESLRISAYKTHVPTVASDTSTTERLEGNELIDSAGAFVALDNGTIFTATTKEHGFGIYTAGASGASFLQGLSIFQPVERLVRLNGDRAIGLLTNPSGDYRLRTFGLSSTSGITLPDGSQGTILLGGLVTLGDRAFFSARNADGTDELWVTEGTNTTTVRLAAGLNPETNDGPLTLLRTDGAKLYFPASDGIHGTEMWVSDGTPDGTHMIADLNQNGGSVDHYVGFTSAVIPQPVPNQYAFFLAQPGGSGSSRLYRTDGTANGTFPVETSETVANFATQANFYIGGTNAFALFRTGNINGEQLWKADPNPAQAQSTVTSLVSYVSFSTATNHFIVDVHATVTSTAGTPTGSVQFDLGNGNNIPSVALNQGTASVGDTLTDSEFTNLLNGNPPIYRAEFISDRVDQFESSSVTGSQFRISPDLFKVDAPSFVSDVSPPEIGAQLTISTGLHTSLLIPQAYLDTLKVVFTFVGPGVNALVDDITVVDGIARLSGPINLPVGEYTIRAVVLKDSTVIAESDAATLTVAPQAPATTTTTLDAELTISFFPEGANASITAHVDASRGQAEGNVVFVLGNQVERLPVVHGVAGPVTLFMTTQEVKDLIAGTLPPMGATFEPTNASYLPSSATGANVKLPEGIVTIGEPMWNLDGVTNGTTLALSSQVTNALGLSLDGLHVKYEARDQNGGKFDIGSGVTAELVDGVATQSVLINLPPGYYTIHAVLVASSTVTLGESIGKPFPVVVNPIFLGNPPAMGRKYSLFSTSDEPTQIVWLSFDGGASILDVGSPYSILTPPRFSATEFGYTESQTELVKANILNRVKSLFGNHDIEFTLTKPDLPEYLYSTVAIGGTPQIRFNTVNPSVARQFGTANPTFADVTEQRFATGISQTVDLGNLNHYDGAVVFSRQIALNYLNESNGYILDALAKQTAIIISHEVGHLLGLRHEENEQTSKSVMISIDKPIPLEADFQNSKNQLKEAWPDGNNTQNTQLILNNLIGHDGSTLIGNDGSTFIGNDGASFNFDKPMFNPTFTLYGADGRTFSGSDVASNVTFRVPGGSTSIVLNIPNLFPNARFSIMGSSTPNGPIDMFSGTPVNGVMTPEQLQVPLFNANGQLNQAIPMATGTMGQLQSAGTASLTPRNGFQPSQPIDARTAFAVGAGIGSAPIVQLVDARTNREYFRIMAYEESFTGGVQVAAADLNGDGMPDLVIGSGVGGGPRVRVINGATRTQMSGPLGDSFVYEPSFRGGVQVAVGDVTGDGTPDLIIGSGVGGGPRVRVLNGRTGEAVYDFFAYEDTFRGGVQVSVADVDGDGRADILAGSGFGGGPRVRVFSGKDLHEISNFFAYEDTFRGGVNVTAGDFDGDGKVEVLAGSGIGGGPAIKLFDPRTAAPISGRFVFDESQRSGVRVTAIRTSENGPSRVVVSSGVGTAPRVKVLDPLTGQSLLDELAFDASFTGGVYVG